MAAATLRKLFEGNKVGVNGVGERNAVTPLTDFFPPVDPNDMEVIAAALDASFAGDWDTIDAVVGIADRSSGPLSHMVALRHNLPYSLANWYPGGSQGDILVDSDGGFTGEANGVVYLNGIKPHSRIVFVDDVIRSGKHSSTMISALQKANVTVVNALFVAEVAGRGGLDALSKMGVKPSALCTVDVEGESSKVISLNAAVDKPLPPFPAVPSLEAIKSRSAEEMAPRFKRVLSAFVGIGVYRADNSDYPYCNFALTDFTPLLAPSLVEDMADCMLWLGSFKGCNIVVSESDRGGGPLVIAVARRLNLPYTMANWSQSPHNVGVAAAAAVGYSGHGKLFLNGITNDSKCVVVDDMLSSGGTAEGLFKAIEAAGGSIVEAHFASEKTTTGGRARLGKTWPSLPLFSLCYFSAGSSKTESESPLAGSNETPIQRIGDNRSPFGSSGSPSGKGSPLTSLFAPAVMLGVSLLLTRVLR